MSKYTGDWKTLKVVTSNEVEPVSTLEGVHANTHQSVAFAVVDIDTTTGWTLHIGRWISAPDEKGAGVIAAYAEISSTAMTANGVVEIDADLDSLCVWVDGLAGGSPGVAIVMKKLNRPAN